MSNFKKYLNVYEFECTLPGSGQVVKFKPMTTIDIKKLLVYEKETNPLKLEEALDELIQSTVISKDFNINDIYLQDRYFLIIEIRKKTKGSKYQFTFKCPKEECKAQTLQTVDLDKLNVKTLKESVGSIKINDDLSITLKHITRGEQKAACENININGLSELQRDVEIAMYTQAASIDKIITPDGTEDISIEDGLFILDNTSNVYDDIKQWHDDNNFGISFTHKIKCVCGLEEDVLIPMENFFF